MSLIINFIFIALIIFIIWWFWLYKPKAVKIAVSDHIKVLIAKGVYNPDMIYASRGKPLHIEFHLKDETHCAATIIFPDLNVSAELTINKPQTVTITPDKIGKFEFTCPMGMYRGQLIVEEGEGIGVGVIDVIIEGGVYIPEIIRAPVGNPVTLRFTRKDESHCAETVVFSDFGISEAIPTTEPKEITITPDKAGEYDFGCPMGMYHGKIIAE